MVGDIAEGELVRDTVGSTIGACRKRDGAGVATVGFLLVLVMGDFVGFTLGL